MFTDILKVPLAKGGQRFFPFETRMAVWERVPRHGSRVLPEPPPRGFFPFVALPALRGHSLPASEPRAFLSSAPPPSRCCAAAWPASAAGGSCPCCCSAPLPSTLSRWPAAAGCSQATMSRRPRCGGSVLRRAAAAGPTRKAARVSWITPGEGQPLPCSSVALSSW